MNYQHFSAFGVLVLVVGGSLLFWSGQHDMVDMNRENQSVVRAERIVHNPHDALSGVEPGNQSISGRMITLNQSRNYYAAPVSDDDAPGLILLHAWWGLTDYVKETADIYASYGYRVVAVDLFNGSKPKTRVEALRLAKDLDRDDIEDQLRRAKILLREEGSRSVGGIGMCMGGTKLMNVMTASDFGLDATIVDFAKPVLNDSKLAKVESPLQGIYGDRDDIHNLADVREMDQRLDRHVSNEIYVYENATHGFDNNQSKASQAIKDSKPFLRRYLKE